MIASLLGSYASQDIMYNTPDTCQHSSVHEFEKVIIPQRRSISLAIRWIGHTWVESVEDAPYNLPELPLTAEGEKEVGSLKQANVEDTLDETRQTNGVE